MNRLTIGNAVALVIVLAGMLGLYVAYRTIETRRPIVESDGRVVARIVDAKLEDAADVRVMRLTGTAQGVARTTRMGGILQSSRIFKAPASVDYFVDVSKLTRRDVFWNDRDRILTVRLPDVRTGAVNIDESRVVLDQTDGLFVSRDAMAELRGNSSIAAHDVARREAQKPENLARARARARSVIGTLFEQPLRAAGIAGRVQVEFAGEGRRNDEQWDVTRSIEEILGSSSP